MACHPVYHRTLTLIQQRFWWPSMAADMGEFVADWSMCAHSKTSPPLHIAVDFITSLPPSEGSTTIVTVDVVRLLTSQPPGPIISSTLSITLHSDEWLSTSLVPQP